MEEQIGKPMNPYKRIIKDYINALNVQMYVVPMSYSLLKAKVDTEIKKVEKFSKDHGEIYEKDGTKTIRMPIECNRVFIKKLWNLGSTAQAYEMTGVNAVIGMVSNYDGLLGNLIKQLYTDTPELLINSEREFKASDILPLSDISDFKDILIEKEVETILRKNHVEQLQSLGSKLSTTLTDFKCFPEFVEIMERRNLFVHCNGIVSRQYILECRKNRTELKDETKPGTLLTADHMYVNKTYKVLYLVGIMVGFVLWHKTRPDESDDLIQYLSDVAYDLIRDEEYELGLDVIDFALTTKSWNKKINNAYQIVFNVNKALAFHLRGLNDECVKIANSIDLTAAIPCYHLAVAVLKEDYEQAYKLMSIIGKDEQMRVYYKEWPLFNRIRKEKAFVDKYEEIYCEAYEFFDTRVADFNEIIKSAMEMVKNTPDKEKINK